MSTCCPNCSAVYEGNFCPNCGQKTLATPYSFNSLGSHVTDLIDFNRGFFFTMFSIIVKPGIFIRGYLNGKTKIYFSPVRYAFTIASFVALIDFVRTWGTGEEMLTPVILLATTCVFLYATIFNMFLNRKDMVVIEHAITAFYQASTMVFIPAIITMAFLLLESYDILPYNDSLAAFLSISFVVIFISWFNLNVFKDKPLISILKTVLFLVGVPIPFLATALMGMLIEKLK